MVNTEYANAYSEVLEILNHIPKSDYNKIPNNIIKLFTTNKNKEYIFNYDVNKTLNEQNVSKKAKTIIAILFRDYWATPYQREKILAKERYDVSKLEKEKREQYNPDSLFKERQVTKKETISDNLSIVEYKEENFVQKLLNKIKKLFKIR